ncbi:WYL domain-containing protein [Streptomyces sp. NPDC058439]|uniref:WYL domain-containing protein n=1 Tax=Streptomyces sp. NPDC058439 TaxID=3346500 RepID=UPI00365ACD05
MAAYVSQRVSSAAWRHHARVTVHAPATAVIEQINPAVGTVEAVDADSCVLTTGADTLQTLAVCLGMLDFDFDFDVTEPEELVTHLRRLAGRYARSTPPTRGAGKNAVTDPAGLFRTQRCWRLVGQGSSGRPGVPDRGWGVECRCSRGRRPCDPDWAPSLWGGAAGCLSGWWVRSSRPVGR